MKGSFIMSISLDGVPVAQRPCLVMRRKKQLCLVKPAHILHSRGQTRLKAPRKGEPMEGDRKKGLRDKTSSPPWTELLPTGLSK